jgi:hypothetical protein
MYIHMYVCMCMDALSYTAVCWLEIELGTEMKTKHLQQRFGTAVGCSKVENKQFSLQHYQQ